MEDFTAWFAGPKAENGEAFADTIRRILEDYHYWRRNYFPEDGVLIRSADQHAQSEWKDVFADRLQELLALLKGDFPFYSPRYAAHMVSEQTLPSIAGYFAGMLYNPNNVTSESAPVTVRLELEASAAIAEMLGYDRSTSWAHLTSGGTVANLEAIWVARTVKYLPLLLKDIHEKMDLPSTLRVRAPIELLGLRPTQALAWLLETFRLAEGKHGKEVSDQVIREFQTSQYNVSATGMRHLLELTGSEPIVFAPETSHYCLPKILDLLGIGRNALMNVRVTDRFRMDIADLKEKVAKAESDGKHVLAVVAVMGTTEEGAVDPLDSILDLRAEREAQGKPSFWVHADAAYGGYLRTVTIPSRIGLGEPFVDIEFNGNRRKLAIELPEHEPCNALERLGECDSIVVDPHKLGYIPYPAGVVCFQSDLVRPLMRQNAPYLEDAPAGPEEERTAPGLGVYVLEGSKPGAAAAAVWLSHTTIPLDTSGHGALMRETIRNAAELHSLLVQWSEIAGPQTTQAVPLCAPDSNIVCYAFRPIAGTPTLHDINKLNKTLYDRFSLAPGRQGHVYEQEFFVSRTVLTSHNYSTQTVAPFLARLGVTEEEFQATGVLLLRSALMNPWYGLGKRRGRQYLLDLVNALHTVAAETVRSQ